MPSGTPRKDGDDTRPLDVLVNNAGTVIPMKVEETTLADFDRVFAVKRPRRLRCGRRRRSSTLKNRRTDHHDRLVPGRARVYSRHGALLGNQRGRQDVTQGLARELGARGITVNNVQPGPIDTDLNPASGEWAAGQKAAVPLGRYGHADEVAALVAFVAGPESSYINGANLTVDGGTNA